MIRKFLSMLACAILAVAATGCSDDDEPSVWDGYAGLRMTSAHVTYYKSAGELPLFVLDLTDGTHSARLFLSTPTPGDEILLPTGDFVFGGMLGDRSTADGAAVTGGKVAISKELLTYTIDCNLEAGGKPFAAKYVGLVYVPETGDPSELDVRTLVAEVVPVQVQGSGYKNTVTVKLATEGVSATYNEATYSYDYAGEGGFLSVDFICATPTLGPGTYTIAANDRAVAGNFVAGYDTTVNWGFGDIPMYNWGSCWFDVADGAAAGRHIEKGTITVATANSVYTIEGRFTLADGTAFKALYTGRIGEMTPEDGDASSDNRAPVIEPTKVTVENLFMSQVQNGTVTLKIATKGIEATYNEQIFGYTYTGSGNYISLDLKVADDATSLPAGTYPVVANDTAVAGNAIAGYDTSMDFGWGPIPMYNWGSCWFTVADGQETGGVHIDSGTVKVSTKGDVFTIVAEVTTAAEEELVVTYTGEIPGMTGGGDDPDPTPGPGGDEDPTQVVGSVTWSGVNNDEFHNSNWTVVFTDTANGRVVTLMIVGNYGDTGIELNKTYAVDPNWQPGGIGAYMSTVAVGESTYQIIGGSIELTETAAGVQAEGSFEVVENYSTPADPQTLVGTFTIDN